ncbi:MAG TPA: S53 family peptidase [Rugosimonospora sp.]|nr:S53 family peptidase [Rugosimonospora sp.]
MADDRASEYVPVPGSRRHGLPGARRIGDAYPHAPVQIALILRRAAPQPGAPASHADLTRVEEFAHAHGLTVSSVNLAARSVSLLGTVTEMNAAFQVSLGEYEVDGRTYRGRVGEIYVPASLAGTVVAVLGLDDRQQARAHFRIAGAGAGGVRPRAIVAMGPRKGYPPQEVARRYGFPTDVDGTGQIVALIELGGGYRTADLKTYFTAQGLHAPAVTAVSVDGAKNSPGQDADGEVMLDIEVVGAVAPGARIAVYFAPNTDNGFYDAIAAAIHDTQRKPSVVSISWGEAESAWTAQAMDAYDALFADAGALGVTVYAAAGDDGASDRATGLNVDFPASSPHVVGCGGTKLTDTDETVWNGLADGDGATGGGVSRHFAPPAYQSAANVPKNPDGKPGRGVPDVAGDADPMTGYLVRVDGADQVIGGTSAVAPLWAALTAIANQRNGNRSGAPHERLYLSATAFHDITTGDNSGYQAATGWDPCTGLGSPLGVRMVQVLGGG